MTIACPGCGRGYDVTLLQFGRTLECTCGARVGQAPPVREEQDAFRRCPGCGRVFWEGSHVRRMRGKLESALGFTLQASGTGGEGTAHP